MENSAKQITIKDIQTAVVNVLNSGGFKVYAWDVRDGFDKPACFVNAYPARFELINKFMEELTVAIEIEYVSATEKWEEHISTTQRIKDLFLYNTLDVCGRHFTIYAIDFEPKDNSLFAEFEITFTQGTGFDISDSYTEKMENLHIGGI